MWLCISLSEYKTPFEIGLMNAQPKSIIESRLTPRFLMRSYSSGPRNNVKEGMALASRIKYASYVSSESPGETRADFLTSVGECGINDEVKYFVLI